MSSNGTNAKPRNGLVAALDVGTTKVCCLIARRGAEGARVIGIGHQISHGVRGGSIVDMDAAEAAIRATVEAAEQMAGENIRQVVVGISGGAPESRLVAYDVAIGGHEISDADLRKVLDPSPYLAEMRDDHELVHAIPVGYSIDGTRGVHDPRGMVGQRLGVNLHLVTAAASTVRNLTSCVTRCHLDVEARIVAPYASAMASLVDDEMQLGVTHIDMGGGSTSIAVYFDGELVHVGVIPVGGEHVTRDIARGLSAPVAHAERMKTLYGSTMPSPSDDQEMLRIPLIGEEDAGEASQVPRSMLVRIIRPRLEEIFEMVRGDIDDAGFDKVAGRRVALTGGASQLPGVPELAAMILDKQVRLARPRPLDGLAEAVSGPAFSTCAGLLAHALNNPAEAPIGAYRPMEEPSSRLGRFGQWFRENF
jgi:cell division protein FtsA